MLRIQVSPLCLAAVLLTAPAALAGAQTSESAPLAKELVTAMTGSGLDAIAARDPQAPDRAIAALAFPGSQLLVVSAPYPNGASLDAYLANHMYRDVYSILQQPSITKGRLFVEDLGCDGLQGSGDATVDVAYDDATQTIFDGNWKKQKLSEGAYEQRVKDVDARYAHLLSALVAAAQAAPKGGPSK